MLAQPDRPQKPRSVGRARNDYMASPNRFAAHMRIARLRANANLFLEVHDTKDFAWCAPLAWRSSVLAVAAFSSANSETNTATLCRFPDRGGR